ncbi:ethanolamine ammonia-lyase subunit EutC [Gordonia sp. CPCC 205515]|uniref:ethanolamine ammonia-lyase subunit EutC n=1 Tax=Gordonia sp. CPCC 205515 TaxID=3140791 RepID=UPI003AF3DCF7
MTNEPVVGVDDPWSPLRRTTQARIGLQRSGNSLSTRDVLEFQSAHAAARDAVHAPLAVDDLTPALNTLGLGEASVVASRATSRGDYLRRPDLGRLPDDLSALPRSDADVGIVVADGLSATAVDDHAVGLVTALVETLASEFTIAAPVIATNARVALGDHIGEALGVEILVMIIGERPGLSVADSLGIYLTYRPRPGRRDSERNCISNIHPPDGLGYADAARIVRGLISGARKLGASGVALKDTSAADADTAGQTPVVDQGSA